MQVKSKEIVSGSCKYYLNTPGFHNTLYNTHAVDIDIRLRNQVYLTLRRAGYQVYAGIHRQRTVDFLARQHDRIIYLQCTATIGNITLAEEQYKTLASIQDNYEKWIISLDSEPARSREGIRNIPAWQLSQLLRLFISLSWYKENHLLFDNLRFTI